MPSYGKELTEYHKERIKELLVLKPKVSLLSIREALQNDHKNPLLLDKDYIAIIIRKIRGERKHRYDREEVNERLAEIQDHSQSVIEQMWGVLLNPTADDRARVGAAKVIIDSEHKFLEAQMDMGVFERKLGTVDVEHTHTLAPEVMLPILRALSNYGIIRTDPKLGLPDPAASRANPQ